MRRRYSMMTVAVVISLLTLLATGTLAGYGKKAYAAGDSPEQGAGDYNSIIQEVFGVTPEITVNKVLVIGETSHNDYNWTDTFENFYSDPDDNQETRRNYNGWDAKIVFDGDTPEHNHWSRDGAFSLLRKYSNQEQKYYYQICEIAFLKRYYEDVIVGKAQFNQDWWTAENLENLRIVGGGMTSPSSLLSTGEAFIRNQLLGTEWVKEHVPAYSDRFDIKYAWMPDSFGMDPNLPALLEAMDLKGFGFGRIGGTGDDIGGSNAVFDGSDITKESPNLRPDSRSPAHQLLDKYGTDFVWNAVDGSSTDAHWLIGMYQMNTTNLNNTPTGQTEIKNQITQRTDVDALTDSMNVQNFGEANKNRDILYIPLSEDMMPVCTNLLNITNRFNEQYRSQGVWAVSGTFDHYRQLLELAGEDLPQTEKGFSINPVSNGVYGSCPEVKRLHQLATNLILTAETLQSICNVQGIPGVPAVNLDDIWEEVVPSTHHGYVTGATTNTVYTEEDLVQLRGAVDRLQLINKQFVSAIAQDSAARANPDRGIFPVVAFNPNGFSVDDTLIEMDVDKQDSGIASELKSTSDGLNVQYDKDAGKLYFFGSEIPSMGYKTISLSEREPTNVVSNRIRVNGESYSFGDEINVKDANNLSIDNGVYRIELSADKDWCVSNIYHGSDRKSPLFATEGGNRYYDCDESPSPYGDAFSFMFDKFQNPFSFKKLLKDINNGTKLVSVTPGRLATTVETVAESGIRTQYKIKYDSKLVEIQALGNTENETPVTYKSIFVKFPLPSVTGDTIITYGTPYHWITEESTPCWKPFTDDCPVFAPSHNFFLAQKANGKTPLHTFLALYHKGVPAFSFYDQSVYGCLWRRVKDGSWYDTEMVPLDATPTLAEYAIRIPDEEILTPAGGTPLKESLEYQKPVTAELVPEKETPSRLPSDSFSLAEAASPAIITAAKPGTHDPYSLVFRVYNPTNAPLDVDIKLPGWAEVVNALEEEMTPSSNESLKQTAASMRQGESGFTEYMQLRSLTTLQTSPIYRQAAHDSIGVSSASTARPPTTRSGSARPAKSGSWPRGQPGVMEGATSRPGFSCRTRLRIRRP